MEDSFGLFRQRYHGNGREATFLRCRNGGIQPVQIHVHSHQKGQSLKRGIPQGIVGRLVLSLQGRLAQNLPEMGNGQQPKLYHAGAIAGDQKDRIGSLCVGSAVGMGSSCGGILLQH